MQTAYVNGAHATHTGRSKESYGTTFHEVQINEGSRAGERALISERQRAEQAGESKSGSTTPPPGARIITPQVPAGPTVSRGDYRAPKPGSAEFIARNLAAGGNKGMSSGRGNPSIASLRRAGFTGGTKGEDRVGGRERW